MPDQTMLQQQYPHTDAIAFARDYYRLSAKAIATHGEEDATFLLQAPEGKCYAMKIAARHPELQLVLSEHLAAADLPFSLPKLQLTSQGSRYVTLDTGHYLYLLSWVPGVPYCKATLKDHLLRESTGRALGQLSQALQGFDSPAAHRELDWDLANLPWVEAHFGQFDAEERRLLQHFYQQYKAHAAPVLPDLRQSVLYNDANDCNLMVQPVRKGDPAGWHYTLSGIIDFGDAVYSHTVNELAVALAYAMMDQPDPAGAAVELIRAYHSAFPLREKEIAVLPALITGRLLLSVTTARLNQLKAPGREYLQISQESAWSLLRRLREIPYALLHYHFRHACGWEPCPQASRFRQWIEEQRPQFAPVCKLPQRWKRMDLGVGSLELGNNQNFEDTRRFERHVERLMEDGGYTFGLGGYREARPFYTTDAYKVEGNEGPRWRSVHLGLDIWAKAGTPVYAPLAGKVHSFADNAAERDYGPTIILEHEPQPGLRFYTLYGHLDRASLKGLEAGMPVRQGQQIAAFGEREVNGEWPPHLHFQLMVDTLGKQGDFPGVGFPEEWAVWSSLCPNPELLLHLPKGSTQAAREEWSGERILQARSQSLGPNLSITYQQPLHVVRAFRHYLYTADGRRYLDTVNNVPHVGHQHPRVVEAVQQQAGLLNTNTRYLHTELARYAEELLATLPEPLEKVYFVTSGSEANELALRMARTATGRQSLLAMDCAYHGHTAACIDISAYKFNGKGGKGQPPHTHLLPLFEQDGEDAARALQKMEALRSQGDLPAAFISESILSCGGQLVPPGGYFKAVFQAVRAAGGLCILDEVQTGFGRVGEAFWAFELQGIVPDIVVMGKPMGNGFPIGAVACTKAVADAFDTGMEFFSTFGGNPVACAAGRAVLQVVQEEGLQERAHETGQLLRQGLESLQADFSCIADVRGHGLFLGVELSKDGQPMTAEAQFLINRMRRLGILMNTDGPDNNVLKIKPPMSFGPKAAEEVLERLRKELKGAWF